jgi:hypothetical protein
MSLARRTVARLLTARYTASAALRAFGWPPVPSQPEPAPSVPEPLQARLAADEHRRDQTERMIALLEERAAADRAELARLVAECAEAEAGRQADEVSTWRRWREMRRAAGMEPS